MHYFNINENICGNRIVEGNEICDDGTHCGEGTSCLGMLCNIPGLILEDKCLKNQKALHLAWK